MKLTIKQSITKIKTFGNSMYPVLLNNDIIILNPSKKLQIDDIVVIEKKSFYITHRIIYIDKNADQIITKGDHNPLPDKPIRYGDVSGKVYKVIREGKTLVIENLYLFQSIFYFNEIKRINSLLSNQKILYVFLKGLPIYLYYTKKPPRRIYADCDILIDPNDLPDVEKIFLSLGYKKRVTSLNPFLDKFLRRKSEVTYWKIIKKVLVSFDIHLEAVFLMVQTNDLYPLYSKSLVKKLSNFLLSEKKIVTLHKNKLPLLTTENQIIYLALHLFHDNFKGYYKYSLLEQVVNSSKFSEEQIIETIKEYKLGNFVYPVFILLIKYYHPNFSKNFLNQIAPQEKLRRISRLIGKINIFEDESRINSGVKRFKNIYYLSLTNELLKPLVFIQPDVLLLTFFSITKKLKLTLQLNFIRFIRNISKTN